MKFDNEYIFKKLNWRYACKKFDPTKKIRESDWHLLSEALRLSASSHGLQPWKFVVVQNPELRQKLFESSYKQTPVIDCSHFIVMCYKEKMDEAFIERHIAKTAEVRELSVEDLTKYKNAMINDLVKGDRSKNVEVWAQRQVYIAMGTLLTTAAMMDIDTLPMEGFVASAYDQILELEDTGWKTVCAVACGYRHPDDKYQNIKKVRFDARDVFDLRL